MANAKLNANTELSVKLLMDTEPVMDWYLSQSLIPPLKSQKKS